MYQGMSNISDVETHLVHCVTVDIVYNIIYIYIYTVPVHMYIYIYIHTQHDKHTHTCCNRHESYYLQVISVNMTQSYFMNQAKHGCKLYQLVCTNYVWPHLKLLWLYNLP